MQVFLFILLSLKSAVQVQVRERPSTGIFMDFKNRGKDEVFKHKDSRVRSLSYLENGRLHTSTFQSGPNN